MQTFLVEEKLEIANICQRHHVRQLAVFGSAAREDFDSGRSDIDLLVEFEVLPIEGYAANKHSLQEELSLLLGCEVDLLVVKYVRNPYLKESIEGSRQTLYAA